MSSALKKSSTPSGKRTPKTRAASVPAAVRAKMRQELEALDAELSILEANEAAMQKEIKSLESQIDTALKNSASRLLAKK